MSGTGDTGGSHGSSASAGSCESAGSPGSSFTSGSDGPDGSDGSSLSVDLHVHTHHSPDAVMSPERVVERAREAGLDRIAVTDHDAIEGAFRARELAPETVIVGQEVSCVGRLELIGLFLEAWIPPGLTVEEAADRIRSQGGVVYAPHPFAYLVDRRRRSRAVMEAADVVEAVNARAFWPEWNRAAREAVRAGGLPGAAGSDAHFPAEVGRAFTRMPAFRTAAEFRAALAGAEPVLRRTTSPVNHVGSLTLRALRYATPGLSGAKGPRPGGSVAGALGLARRERSAAAGTAPSSATGEAEGEASRTDADVGAASAAARRRRAG